jgi:DNA-binding response OmpR family regulator
MAKRILVVEDHEDTLLFLRDLLEGEGYRVQTAATAAQAEASARIERPDLILLDVMLPDGDGVDLARSLSADSRLAGVPIVLVTALSFSTTLETEARQVPAVRRILYKPCRPRTLLEVVEDALQPAPDLGRRS